MDDRVRANRAVWEQASSKYVREFDDLLDQARAGGSLLPVEQQLLAGCLAEGPRVVHLQSGNGLDDPDLIRAGATSVTGVDYSIVAATAAQRRADLLGLDCRYLVAEVPVTPLRTGSVDLVYTGKGALIWIRDLTDWATEVARLLRPGGRLFVYEAHPMVPLWGWDTDVPRVRADRSYFADRHVNESFPAGGAVEWQRTLGQIVTAVIDAGLRLVHLAEYAAPFWRPDGVRAAAWDGRLPNAFSLQAVLPDR